MIPLPNPARRPLLIVRGERVSATRVDTQGVRSRGRRLLRVAVVALGAVLTALLVAAMVWPPIDDVTTGMTAEYPDLAPQVLRYGPALVFERACRVVEELPRWRLEGRDASSRRIEAQAGALLPGLVQDVSIRVDPYGSGSLVTVRSRSRGGRGDFGQNARNIRQFQRALEEELQLARAVR